MMIEDRWLEDTLFAFDNESKLLQPAQSSSIAYRTIFKREILSEIQVTGGKQSLM